MNESDTIFVCKSRGSDTFTAVFGAARLDAILSLFGWAEVTYYGDTLQKIIVTRNSDGELIEQVRH